MAAAWMSENTKKRLTTVKPKSYNVYLEKDDGSKLLLDAFKSRAAAEKYAADLRIYKVDGKPVVQDIY